MSDASPLPNVTDERPLPIVTEESRPYWEAAKAHRLLLPACGACGEVFFPISPVCPSCFAERDDWREVSGRGTVSSFVIFHQPFFAFFRDKVPYAVVQVKLEEGPRVNGNMLDIPAHDIRIGMDVESVFEKVSEEITLPQFRPARK